MFIDDDLRKSLKIENPSKLKPHDFFKLIIDAIEEKMPYLERDGETHMQVIERLDYGMASAMTQWETLSDIAELEYAEPFVVPRLGNNEGAYVDAYFRICEYGEEDRIIPLFSFKTLGDGFDDMCVMGVLAGALTYAIELFLIVNVL